MQSQLEQSSPGSSRRRVSTSPKDKFFLVRSDGLAEQLDKIVSSVQADSSIVIGVVQGLE